MTRSSTLRQFGAALLERRPLVLASVGLMALTVLASVGLMGTSGLLISKAALRPPLLDLMVFITIVRFFGLSRGLLRYLERLVSHDLTFRIIKNIRVGFYQRLEPLSPGRLWLRSSGDLLSRAVADVDGLQLLYLRALAPSVAAVIVALATAGGLLLYSHQLAVIALLGFAVAGLGVPALGARLARGVGVRMTAIRGQLQAAFITDLTGLADLLALGLESARTGYLQTLDAELGALQARQARLNGLVGAAGGAAASLTMLGMIVGAAPLVLSGQIPGPSLALLALGTLAGFEAVTGLGQAFVTAEAATAAAARLDEATAGSPFAPPPVNATPGSSDFTLEFDDVTFRFPGEPARLSAALRNLNLTLRPGARIAVVGPSGAGKSVLVNIAARLWDPTSGAVKLGGVDLRRLADADLRRAITVVSQDAYAFDSSFRENLRFAKPEATDEELWDALQVAGLSALVRSLPGGLDSWVGEAGARISGGERQRLSIARAALRRAPILILDEPTANLDPRTEAEVLDRLDDLTRGRSVLMVTHRLVRLDSFDEVIVLDAGRIIERGRAADLTRKGGVLANMLAAQQAQLPVGAIA